ncbi:preprotein translocase subunit SecG [Sulfoacidibacillus thermotolerans]|uniref:Protein-export membrane protein SecG n=1 Tax=Sulfoacidibacillus thermotolerans TaxID=1765684 RepID=A0A2U3D9D4_SULT2|nr:preprotein translocase subunit SecG [Sulfoacidibacillus thermotolerans]PWI57873.1 preprotein translocase subunit SecG [Sulfoacidibacillus thermotolerans]
MLSVAKILLVIISVVLVTVVLLQSGRSAGLGAITGGGNEVGASRRNRGTDPMLARITMVVAFLFFVDLIWIAWMVSH